MRTARLARQRQEQRSVVLRQPRLAWLRQRGGAWDCWLPGSAAPCTSKVWKRTNAGRSKRLLRHILGQRDALESRLRELIEKDAREFDEVVRLRVARNAAGKPEAKSALARQANDLRAVATDNAFRKARLSMSLARG
ncbi:hypothetical protein AB3X91_39190 [Paraburkholderia sp. BR14263]|uniref:hypothetical protein n=1 Tax=unclassified Paraburkholderia TaxID=2615204 RepID=UPI0034CF45C3